ncbi:DinB family protein [Telmatocola sphagniphila]|uniref:DinB family protein n=1 Tax=Telmatocola sphagniphila TaxID=1123043 RepID=A0A8E6B5U4_9BACT|nr:DinB family protein [Telmatocola sphagniphila]QVL32009.1 DinB family protein [Telmatocola sphagniphila]
MILDTFRSQILFARSYTIRILDKIPESLWFQMPQPAVTHVAWQVGHLAMAQYRLGVERIRGIKPEDASIISDEFIGLFRIQTVPQAESQIYPSPSEIRKVFDAVHQLVLSEIPTYASVDLTQPPVTPHSICKTKSDILVWCSHHEFLHAGQIGLLRRLFGEAPIW